MKFSRITTGICTAILCASVFAVRQTKYQRSLDIALIQSVKANRSSEVHRLLASGASANAVDYEVDYSDGMRLHGWRRLLPKTHPSALQILLDEPFVKSPLWPENTAILQDLLKHNAEVDIRNADGYTPLFGASYKGYYSSAKLLLQHGANISAKSLEGYTPLHLGAWANRDEVCVLLITHRAAVDAKDELGDTPLALAAMNGAAKSAEELLHNSADPLIVNRIGNNSIDIAKFSKSESMQRLLKPYDNPAAPVGSRADKLTVLANHRFSVAP